MKLYHGSRNSVEKPDMQKCRLATDFGHGFYTHFEKATQEWLEFVIKNRRGITTENYDFVMGPVANDALYATILLYEQGILTANAAIEQLKTHTLFDQLSFHTEKALKCIRFVEVIPIVS